MFSTQPRSSATGFASAVGAYHEVGVQTEVSCASAHGLIQMLFQGFHDAVAQARGAMRAGQIEAKGRAISRALRIVDEGLKASLDVEAGGALAADLNELYAYVTRRLVEANLHNDESALEECERLITPLSKAWAEIGDRV
jgi:flagellar protein FliS